MARTALVEHDDGELELIAWRPATSIAAMPVPVKQAASPKRARAARGLLTSAQFAP